jgi:hypothetical protein
LCSATTRGRRLERLRAAVADDDPAARAELVPARVPAEVVERVQDQDARVMAELALVEARRRQAADAAAHDDEVVALAGVRRGG